MLLLRFAHDSDGFADAVCADSAVVSAATATRAARRIVRVRARRGSLMIIHSVVGADTGPDPDLLHARTRGQGAAIARRALCPVTWGVARRTVVP
ncbi:hypothetical protein GCM10022415_27210 [Knoellia locipacati]|uniref:Uncharacterized protein n=1 Tax=Knoellia locipacati TaxID=882824 RepID=A0A512T3K2_9MICO|nr:hypothetical protein KLO01_27180 [Knoellia locipacati]